MEDKPSASRSTCAGLGSAAPPDTPRTSPLGEEVKNRLSHGGICIDCSRWKVFGISITRHSPTAQVALSSRGRTHCLAHGQSRNSLKPGIWFAAWPRGSYFIFPSLWPPLSWS